MIRISGSDAALYLAEIRHENAAFWAAFAEAATHDLRAQPYKDLILAVNALPAPRQEVS